MKPDSTTIPYMPIWLQFVVFYGVCNPLLWMVAISAFHQIRNPKAKDEYDKVRKILASRPCVRPKPFFEWLKETDQRHLAKMAVAAILVYLVLNWWYA
jgi:hypothetical protein